MKLKEIKIKVPNEEYVVQFDDGFETEISHDVRRSMGHHLYTNIDASYSLNGTEMGSTYLCKQGKHPRPKDDTNTVSDDNLETVMGHLEALQRNPKVRKQSSHGDPFNGLIKAVSALMEMYGTQKGKYDRQKQREAEKAPTVYTF
jgi:hypothetical protein